MYSSPKICDFCKMLWVAVKKTPRDVEKKTTEKKLLYIDRMYTKSLTCKKKMKNTYHIWAHKCMYICTYTH